MIILENSLPPIYHVVYCKRVYVNYCTFMLQLNYIIFIGSNKSLLF